MRKAEALSLLNFLALVVIVTSVVIMLFQFLSATTQIDDKFVTHYQNSEVFWAGTNTFLGTTERESGKTYLELLSLVTVRGDLSLQLGSVSNPKFVNVGDGMTETLDNIFGKGKWHLNLPLPFRGKIRVVIPTDVSGSMCDDVNDIIEQLPKLLRTLRQKGKNLDVTMYLLEGQGSCSRYNMKDIKCSNFPQFDFFKCKSINTLKCERFKSNGLNTQKQEDWGTGLACIVEAEGPDWADDEVFIGMPLSDELPMGCECGPGGMSGCARFRTGQGCWTGGMMTSDAACTSQKASLENGIKAAKGIGMTVFPLKGNPCLALNPACGGTPVYVCAGEDYLVQYMEKIANETNGAMQELTDATEAADKIAEVLSEVRGKDIPPINLGSEPPFKGFGTYKIPVPLPETEEYVFATLTWWV